MSDLNLRMNTEGVTVYSIPNRVQVINNSDSEGYYKLFLLDGNGSVQYGSKTLSIKGWSLLLCKPGIKYNWTIETNNYSSYACVIAPFFLSRNYCFQWLNESKVFNSEMPVVLELTLDQFHFFGTLFNKMGNECVTKYRFRNHLIQNQLCILLHAALRIEPSERFTDPAPHTIKNCTVLVKLIEMQFPREGHIIYLN